jgi:hypothetical protein
MGSSRAKKQSKIVGDGETGTGKKMAQKKQGGEKSRDDSVAVGQPFSRPQRNISASVKVLADRAQRTEAAAIAAAETKAKEDR